MTKRFLIIFLLVAVLLGFSQYSVAVEPAPVRLTLFVSQGCPHCAAELEYLAGWRTEYPNLQITALEVSRHPANAQFFQAVASKLGIDAGSVPLTVVGDQYLVGFSESITGPKIRNLVSDCQAGGCRDVVAEILSDQNQKLLGNFQSLISRDFIHTHLAYL